jgi:hypothetical protein
VVEVDRDQRFLGVVEDALQRTLGGLAQEAIDLLGRRRATCGEREIDEETLIVGTRTENPSSFPFSSGRTRPTEAAAPVLVGIMDIVAERARRRSE